jgi:hypothetical protein
MRPVLAAVAALAIAMFAISGASVAAAGDDPKQVVASLYAKGDEEDIRALSNVYSARLTALFEKDGALAEEQGGLGNLDFDFLSDSQDPNVTDLEIGAPEIDGERATVAVDFKNWDKPTALVFDLVREEGAWRVDDVRKDGEEGWSLARILAGE